MSILSTVKKGYLYMKTSTGYLKLLPRTLASLVSLDNGNSVETEISNIKTAATNLSSTVSGHTTTLNSHGSSISAIKTKTDALKNAANKTVANNLTTTVDGYVLDARMGKSLQDSITTLNSTSSKKIDAYEIGVGKEAVWTGEYLQGKKIYTKMIDCGALPNKKSKIVGGYIPAGVNLDYIWIDVSNSFGFNDGAKIPLPYADQYAVSNSIRIRLTGYGKTITIDTGADWSNYAAIITVKYTIK